METRTGKKVLKEKEDKSVTQSIQLNDPLVSKKSTTPLPRETQPQYQKVEQPKEEDNPTQ